MANVGPGAFKLQLPDTGILVDGRFDTNQEALVLEALKNHRIVRLRVKGTAEFSTRDRLIKRLTQIDKVSLAQTEAVVFDEAAPPIWEQLAEIGMEAPAGTWETVPNDLSMRIDEIVYGQGESNR